MAPRSTGSASVLSGLGSITVKIYADSQPSAGLSFNILHARWGSRVRQQYVCAKDGEKVERDETVRGYEVAKDQYVTFTKAELEALEEAASQSIEIADFVLPAQVDPIYCET